jgi:hypothetical protein
MKFKSGDKIYKNPFNYFNQDGSSISVFDKPYTTIYEIDIASESGQFYTLVGDVTKTTYISLIIDFEFEQYSITLDRMIKIKKILFNIYN